MKKVGISLVSALFLFYTGSTVATAETHEVEKGDSLWEIAKEHDTTVDNLVDINDLKTTVIQPKQEITLQEMKTYMVEKGDTLLGIADDHDVTVDQLMDWNNLDSSLIVIGEKLKLQDESEKAPAKEESSSSNNEDTGNQEAAESSSQKADTSEQTKEKQESADAAAANEQSQEQTSNQEPQGESFQVSATAYTASCDGCSGVTSTGVDLNSNPNAKVIAVDPSVIPLGSEVYVEGYGYATAADTGGAINGNKIDVHVPSKDEAYNWGVQNVTVTIVD